MAERLHLITPTDPASLVTDGAVALQVGAISVASSDFDEALAASPESALALYGKALTELLKNRNASALNFIGSIDESNLSPAAQSDIVVVKAACLAETDAPDQALSTLSETDDPAGLELAALTAYRQNKK